MTEAPDRRVLRLLDGRALAYREWGDLGGSPVVFVHGSPSSSVWSPDPHQDVTRALAVRLISVDRPGFGGSDVKPGLTLGDWPADVAELADGLGLDRFAVVGVSAGGAWVAACAGALPARVAAVGIASSRGLGQYNVRERPQAVEEFDEDEREQFEVLRDLGPDEAAKRLAARIEDWMRGLLEQPNRFLAGYEPSEGDRWLFDDPTHRELFLESFREFAHQGPMGHAWELVAVMQPWSFRLAEISVPVRLWHGAQDPGVALVGQEFAAET